MRTSIFVAAVVAFAGCKEERQSSQTFPMVQPVVEKPPVVQFDLRERAAAEPPTEPREGKAEAKGRSTPPAASPTTNKEYLERTKQLLEAAEKGRLSLIMDLLKKGSDVNDKDDDGTTALHKAAANGHKSVVLSLLVLGADMNERDAKGRTPVMMAAEAGNAEVLSLLLSPSKVKEGAADALGAALKEIKLNTDALQNKLSNASNSANELMDKNGQTAYMLAAIGGHADCIEVITFIDYQRSRERVLRADKKGRNSIMHAAAGGHVPTLDKIFNSYFQQPLTLADLRATDEDGKTALDLAEASKSKLAVRRLGIELGIKAAQGGDLSGVKSAMEKYPDDITAQKVLFAAARAGKTEVVRYVMGLWKDKSVDEKLELVGAADRPHTVLHESITGTNAETIKALIDADWWKDKPALLRFLTYRYQKGNATVEPILASEYYRKEAPALIKIIEDKFKELQPPPEKK